MAGYRSYLEQSNSDPAVLAFWDQRIAGDPAAQATEARRELKGAPAEDILNGALNTLKAAWMLKGCQSARSLTWPSILIDRYPGDDAKNTEGLRLPSPSRPRRHRQGARPAICR